ncbi:hypothetical protein BpHYR1_013671 [Brachionus plicatilis]|uniref:Uncharacterized protein n=1 Tax=Brachionus plicatilis TaxID=10195 RepID=A0A3M7SX85_BRAPC|nr:hypothetical protein BpHYR1_013671 [Brachionus plicatilis]
MSIKKHQNTANNLDDTDNESEDIIAPKKARGEAKKKYNFSLSTNYLIMAKYDELKNINFDLEMSTLKNCTIYSCFHIIALAVNQKFLEIPIKYNKDSIAPKAKEGRKDNAKNIDQYSSLTDLFITIFIEIFSLNLEISISNEKLCEKARFLMEKSILKQLLYFNLTTSNRFT